QLALNHPVHRLQHRQHPLWLLHPLKYRVSVLLQIFLKRPIWTMYAGRRAPPPPPPSRRAAPPPPATRSGNTGFAAPPPPPTPARPPSPEPIRRGGPPP